MTVPLSKASRKVNILETSQLSVRRKKVRGTSRDVEDTGEYLHCHLMALSPISLRLQGSRKKSFFLPPKCFPLLKIISISIQSCHFSEIKNSLLIPFFFQLSHVSKISFLENFLKRAVYTHCIKFLYSHSLFLPFLFHLINLY